MWVKAEGVLVRDEGVWVRGEDVWVRVVRKVEGVWMREETMDEEVSVFG